MNTTVIIPAYEPDEKMRTLVAQLKEKDFNILIIDDGSGDSFQPLFENLPGYGKYDHGRCRWTASGERHPACPG